MNPDQRALLNCAIAYPDDDMPRLVYCDWLEEFGDAEGQEQAAFIRSQLKTFLSSELKFPRPGVSCFYNRGFINEVRCSMTDWLECGPQLCDEHPIYRVDITDKSPMQLDRGSLPDTYFWIPNDWTDPYTGHIPHVIVGEDRFRPFETEQLAKDWLSASCIVWANSQAPSLALA